MHLRHNAGGYRKNRVVNERTCGCFHLEQSTNRTTDSLDQGSHINDVLLNCSPSKLLIFKHLMNAACSAS